MFNKERIKKSLPVTLPTLTVLVGNVASASGSGSSESVVTALQAVATDITATIGAIAPVALGIAGTFLVWRYGMRFFKSISK